MSARANPIRLNRLGRSVPISTSPIDFFCRLTMSRRLSGAGVDAPMTGRAAAKKNLASGPRISWVLGWREICSLPPKFQGP
jgi:hypothetical protein